MTDTTSAHRSPEPAHRSGGGELKTEVFIVKTPDDKDAVIVSFVDDGEINGIYLYEPGAEPEEVDGVTVTGVATEFEHATVTVHQRVDTTGIRLSYGPANHHVQDTDYPGDVMVTRAERDAAVEQATEDHDNLQQAHDALHQAAQGLVLATREVHRESHEAGPQSLCADPVCRAAEAVTGEL